MTTSPPLNLLRIGSVFLPYITRRWAGLVGVGVTTLLMTLLSVLKPWPMKFIVDYALLGDAMPQDVSRTAELLPGGGTRMALLWWGVGATVLLFMLGWIARLASAMAHVAFGQRMVYDLAADLYAHLQRLSLQFHHRKAVGDSIRRITSDCGCISALIRDAMLPVLSAFLMLGVMIVVMWQLDPVLTLLAVAVMPALVMVLRLHAKPMMDRSYQQQEIEGRVYGDIEQTFSAIPVVQLFARESLNDRQFRAHTNAAVAAALATTSLQLRFKILVGLCTALGTAAIIWVAAQHALDGSLSVGTILVFLSYLSSLYGPIESIMYGSIAAQGAAGSARRVVEILLTQRDVEDRPHAIVLPRVVGSIVFDQVSFAYEPDRDVLRQIGLEISPGQTVALVGASGAGKTTLVSLIPRFHDPRGGRVLIDGHDIRDVTLSSLRQQISLVLQETFLFPLSIAQNIAYGRPDATHDQIVAAARTAGAHEFIMRMPDGYDTLIGERGATLSGGERQRIAIARALLRDAPILILDEPTSHLDTATEQSVLRAMRTLMRGRTTLVIAHRLSTVVHADRIVVLDGGRIVETGTHNELISRAGSYARLYQSQFLHANGGQPS